MHSSPACVYHLDAGKRNITELSAVWHYVRYPQTCVYLCKLATDLGARVEHAFNVVRNQERDVIIIAFVCFYVRVTVASAVVSTVRYL